MGLGDGLARVAAFPAELRVRGAPSGAVLGVLPLGQRALQRYGAAYATVARADLHGLLLDAVRQQDAVALHLGQRLQAMAPAAGSVTVRTVQGSTFSADALVGADGAGGVRCASTCWAMPVPVRPATWRTVPWCASRICHLHCAPRWLPPGWAPGSDVVQYPVKGEWLNVVVIVQGTLPGDVPGWDRQRQRR